MVSKNIQPAIGCGARHKDLFDIKVFIGIERLTEMADLSGFRTSGFGDLTMTYSSPRSAPLNDDITGFPLLDLDR